MNRFNSTFRAKKPPPKPRFGYSRARNDSGAILEPDGYSAIPEARKASRTKPRKQKGGFRSVRRDRADHFFSLFIRTRDRWQCQRCLTQYEVGSQGLHNSHHFGRARENTRYDEINCDAICHGCHSYFTANPAEHVAWKLKRIGQAEYDKLTIRANTRCKKDRQLVAMVWKQAYEKEKLRFQADDA